MIWLILSVIASTGLFVVFELIRKQGINLFPTIVVNYLVCSVCGNLLLGQQHLFRVETLDQEGFPYLLFMGALFIGAFFLMGLATANAGSAKSSVASKMSVILPVLAAVVILKQDTNTIQIIGILIGLLCVYFITKRNRNNENSHAGHTWLLLLVFIGSGLVDTGLNFLSHFFSQSHTEFPIFSSTFVFTSAFILGFLIYMFKVRKTQSLGKNEVIAGIGLGLINFFSLFCVFKALDVYASNTAHYWMLNNIGVVLLSTLVSVFLFKRKLDKSNYIGLALAIVAIVLLNL